MDQGNEGSPGRSRSAPPGGGEEAPPPTSVGGLTQSSGVAMPVEASAEVFTTGASRYVTPPPLVMITTEPTTPTTACDSIIVPSGTRGPGGNAVTRVMSPKSSSDALLDWRRVRAPCATCGHLLTDPAICACCGTYGHDVCLGIERFQDYDFCGACIPRVTAEYAQFRNSQLRASWRQSLTEQARRWQQRAIETIGHSTTIGVAIGGTIATVAGAAAGLATGAVAGAMATRATSPGSPQPEAIANGAGAGPEVEAGTTAAVEVEQPPQPPPPPPAAVLRPRSPKCNACWRPHLGVLRPLVHAFTPDCTQPAPVAPQPPPGGEPASSSGGRAVMPVDLFSPPDAQSQFDSAGSGGEGTGTMPPPAPPKPPGPAGE